MLIQNGCFVLSITTIGSVQPVIVTPKSFTSCPFMSRSEKILFLLLFIYPFFPKYVIYACPLKLPTTTISVKGHNLIVELAVTTKERSCGLSNRPLLGENKGMLFVYPKSRKLSFWMKNTWIPLSIAFVDASGKIINIENMVPAQTKARYCSAKPALYALEVNQGWFQSHGIGNGDKILIKPQ